MAELYYYYYLLMEFMFSKEIITPINTVIDTRLHDAVRYSLFIAGLL